MTEIIYQAITTGFTIAYILTIPPVLRMRNNLRKERRENNYIMEALKKWLAQEKKFARDKKTFSKAMQNTKTPFQEGFNMSDMVETISTGSEMINESYLNAEKAEYELLETLTKMDEVHENRKEEKCG